MSDPRRKTDLLSRLSHDIRSPLHGIIGFADIMHRGKVGPVSDRHREFLGDILSSARRLAELIDELFTELKSDLGRKPLAREVLDLRGLTDEVREGLRAHSTLRGITVEVEVDADLGTIVGDRERTRQILHDELAYALELAPEEGRVTIRCRAEDAEGYRIEVTGKGGSFAAVLPKLPAA